MDRANKAGMCPAPEGGTKFSFPAARNPGSASALTGFWVIWCAAIWFIVTKHAPFIFPLFFGFFELLLGYGAIQLWLGTSRVVIGSGRVLVRSGLLGTGSTRQIVFSDVATIQAAITSQQGSGSSGTPYYDLQLLQTNGTKTTLGKTIRNKQEAEFLAAEMRRLTAPKAQQTVVAGG